MKALRVVEGRQSWRDKEEREGLEKAKGLKVCSYFVHCSILVSVAMGKYITKGNLRDKGVCFSLHPQVISYLLVCSLTPAWLFFLYSQIHLPRDGVVLTGLGPPTSLASEDHLSERDVATGQAGQSSSFEVSSSHMTLGGIKLTIKT